MNELAHCKLIDAADFSHPALLPYLLEIARGEMRRFGLSEPVIIPDSKQWECAMMLRTLSEQGVLRPGALLAGIGAGTEDTTFALASKGCVVFPIDRYLELTPWSDVAPAGMMVRAAQFSQFDCDSGAVIPVHGDARALSLPTDFFDGVYSAGSIEHFGSLEAVAASAEEIGRVLKPGGVAVLSTEYRLDGPNDRQWFSDDCILFTPELLSKYIIEPSGLTVLGMPDFSTSAKTYDSQVVLTEFLEKAKQVRTLTDKRDAYPNLVLFHDGFLFCSVHLALRKDASSGQRRGVRSSRFESEVAAAAVRASGVLTTQIVNWAGTYGLRSESGPTVGMTLSQAETRIAEIEGSWHQMAAALTKMQQSRSWRITRPLREFAQFARTTPVLREIGVFVFRVVRYVRRMFR